MQIVKWYPNIKINPCKVRMEIVWFIIGSFFMGLAGLATFIYFAKKGQFDDPEDPKFQMFRDD